MGVQSPLLLRGVARVVDLGCSSACSELAARLHGWLPGPLLTVGDDALLWVDVSVGATAMIVGLAVAERIGGATVGKLCTGIRVVDADGARAAVLAGYPAPQPRPCPSTGSCSAWWPTAPLADPSVASGSATAGGTRWWCGAPLRRAGPRCGGRPSGSRCPSGSSPGRTAWSDPGRDRSAVEAAGRPSASPSGAGCGGTHRPSRCHRGRWARASTRTRCWSGLAARAGRGRRGAGRGPDRPMVAWHAGENMAGPGWVICNWRSR